MLLSHPQSWLENQNTVDDGRSTTENIVNFPQQNPTIKISKTFCTCTSRMRWLQHWSILYQAHIGPASRANKAAGFGHGGPQGFPCKDITPWKIFLYFSPTRSCKTHKVVFFWGAKNQDVFRQKIAVHPPWWNLSSIISSKNSKAFRHLSASAVSMELTCITWAVGVGDKNHQKIGPSREETSSSNQPFSGANCWFQGG